MTTFELVLLLMNVSLLLSLLIVVLGVRHKYNGIMTVLNTFVDFSEECATTIEVLEKYLRETDERVDAVALDFYHHSATMIHLKDKGDGGLAFVKPDISFEDELTLIQLEERVKQSTIKHGFQWKSRRPKDN
jgi:hypothetical protein